LLQALFMIVAPKQHQVMNMDRDLVSSVMEHFEQAFMRLSRVVFSLDTFAAS
jgi:hypothetical protein